VGIPFAVWLTFLFLLLLVMQLLRGSDTLLGSAANLGFFLKLIGFLSPHFLVMAVPIAFLLALLLGLGRLMEDREVVALNALGVSPRELLQLPFLMGALLGAGLFVLAASADPWGQTHVKKVIAELVKKNVMGDVKPGIFYEDLTNLTLYVQKVDLKAGKWSNVLVHDDRDPRAPLLVLAHEGTVDPKGPGASLAMALRSGEVHRAEQSGTDYTVLTFDHGQLNVGVGETLFRKDRFRSPKDELTPAELWQTARQAKAAGEDPRPFLTAFFLRLNQLFTPLSFALLAGPLALARRQGRGSSYFFALLGYVLYYVLTRAFEGWGSMGRIPPWLAGAGTNLLFASLGLWLLRRVTRLGAAQ
jgi:lipopolysaccharide export system permease protein